jgi:type IV secretory pathway VirB2 component (pilin)
MDIVRLLHSWVRWLVVLAAVLNIAYFAVAWLRSRPYDATARRVISLFAGLISLQWLLGVILLIVFGSQTGFGVRHYWEHLTMMTLAVFVANGPNMLRRRQLTDAQRALVNVICTLVVIVLVIVGISLLPEAIRWRFLSPA